MNIVKRLKAPTPKFFRVLRTIGLAMAAAGGAIMTPPITLPAEIVALGGYFILAGSIISAVSQATVEENIYKDD